MDNVTWQAFASGYYQFDTQRVPNGPSSTDPVTGDALSTEPSHREYARNHGFGIPFVGGDFAYAGEHGGVTVNLRFGEAAPLLIAGFNNYALISNVKQGFASWYATESLSIDLGFFDTVYGAEVADEWLNVNYTRGALYFLMQPFNHTGLRVNYAVSDTVGLKFLVVNGNFDFADVRDLNEVPAFGAQVTLAPSENVFLAVGYATQAENGNNDWGHFIDVVATIGLTDSMKLVLNADLRFNPMLPGDTTVDALYFGASAALGYRRDRRHRHRRPRRVPLRRQRATVPTPRWRREPHHRHPHLPLHPRRQRHPDPRAAPRLGERGHLRDPRWRGGHQHVHQHPRRSHRPHRQLSRTTGVGYRGAWVKRALPVSSCWCSAGCCFSAPSPGACSTPSSNEKTRVGLAWPTRRG
jgi:hypothetical protein